MEDNIAFEDTTSPGTFQADLLWQMHSPVAEKVVKCLTNVIDPGRDRVLPHMSYIGMYHPKGFKCFGHK